MFSKVLFSSVFFPPIYVSVLKPLLRVLQLDCVVESGLEKELLKNASKQDVRCYP